MRNFLSQVLIASCYVSVSMLTSDISEAKSKVRVSKIRSFNPDQRKKFFELAIKECSKRFGGAGYLSPEVNYVTGNVVCRG